MVSKCSRAAARRVCWKEKQDLHLQGEKILLKWNKKYVLLCFVLVCAFKYRARSIEKIKKRFYGTKDQGDLECLNTLILTGTKSSTEAPKSMKKAYFTQS